MAPTVRHIGSYATQEKFSVNFFVDEFIVTVTPDPSVIGQWIHDVLFYNRFSSHSLVVGVGVQWTPPGYNYSDSPPVSFYSDSSSGGYYDPPADTLQLCVGNRCLIIQLGYCNQVPNSLRSFLADPETTFVGVWNSQDAGKLARSIHQLEIGKLLDVRKYVNDSRGRSMRGCSFEEIVEECMGYRGVRLDRAISMSDWSVYNLDCDQVLQASIDAHVCYRLGVWACLWEV